MGKKVILMVLDGWGLGDKPEVSAIAKANTPFMDSLFQSYPHSRLEASGLAVGLPLGQMGNSEVGHMNIGAGRVVYQDLVKVTKALDDGSLAQDKVLQDAFTYAKKENKKVHYIGLVSDGGVHSHIDHLKGLCSLAADAGLEQVYVHAFTDGRDTDPKSGLGYLQDLQAHLETTGGKIASVTGRYFAMDRDKRWERVKLAYDAMVHGAGVKTQDVLGKVKEAYTEGVTDEFIKPIIATDAAGQPVAKIEEGDVVLCFNFRTDRGREITEVLSQRDFPELEMYKKKLRYITLTNYDDTFQKVEIIFDKDNLEMTLGEVLANAGKKQIRIAETEKYPHVTFFFSGGRETEFEGETRLMAPSPKVATYDLQPEMSAYDLRDKIIPELEKEEVDFVILNFANPDMVGHTGVFEAAVKACEVVDGCAKAVVETGLSHGYSSIVIADHGNSDFMVNEDGSPNTAHTTNLVPCIVVTPEKENMQLKDGKLGDLAPTILHMMGVGVPPQMTGDNLISK